ncbi:MAG TPA: methyltransferase domain-containing protein [Chitinophagaceae bacterium]|jgi:ubiquinone/menaquinone biosynthesis C-methylase UbiE|nr:methyltransferase domain-containing protein [Chitinophagaceae bacterium]
MEAALQRRVQRYGWDKAVRHYENFWQRQLKPAQDKLLEMASLHRGEKLIDIACGTGLVSFPAAEKLGPDGFVLATDISDGMIKSGADLAKEKNYQNIKFERMDAEELKVSDEEYDVALCALGLMYFPDPVKALKEMYRVIKPDGRAVGAVWGQRDHCGWSAVFEIVDKRVHSEVCPLFFNLGNSDMLKRNFEAAGFSNVHFERLNADLIYHSDDEACGAAFAGGPVALAYNKFSEQVKKEAHAEYLDSIKPFRRDNGYVIPGEFVIAIGFK